MQLLALRSNKARTFLFLNLEHLRWSSKIEREREREGIWAKSERGKTNKGTKEENDDYSKVKINNK